MGFSPEFRVNDFSFSRVTGGADDGAVAISYWRGEDMIGSAIIDGAGWASVLAHVCKAPHDGAAFAAATKFHEDEFHAGHYDTVSEVS